MATSPPLVPQSSTKAGEGGHGALGGYTAFVKSNRPLLTVRPRRAGMRSKGILYPILLRNRDRLQPLPKATAAPSLARVQGKWDISANDIFQGWAESNRIHPKSVELSSMSRDRGQTARVSLAGFSQNFAKFKAWRQQICARSPGLGIPELGVRRISVPPAQLEGHQLNRYCASCTDSRQNPCQEWGMSGPSRTKLDRNRPKPVEFAQIDSTSIEITPNQSKWGQNTLPHNSAARLR